MLLIHLLKILFCFLLTSHCIRWISYHIHHRKKKTRVFHGNTRMPKELEFALMYGLFAKRRKRVKDLSYRKSLKEWRALLNTVYPSDNVNIKPHIQTDLKSPLGDLGVATDKKKPFSKIKTGNNNFKKIHNVFTAKPCAKNYGVIFSPLVNKKIVRINNLKISQNPIPFPKQILACR